jgi:hypothetical protein
VEFHQLRVVPQYEGTTIENQSRGNTMPTKRKKVEAGIKMAAAVVTLAGKKVARKLALAGDDTLVKLGNAARRRQRARTTESVLKSVAKVALVTGAVVAGRAALKRRGR